MEQLFIDRNLKKLILDIERLLMKVNLNRFRTFVADLRLGYTAFPSCCIHRLLHLNFQV
ncbi:hypothetical protein ARSQ2_01443 [Arsenophonus endosymbiont of Bemisia tabaci Q2]|nr:hypothetical protein ARSQ2_01443 [Arsenophonus endosymbiont of Bemisia tabaci Q2]